MKQIPGSSLYLLFMTQIPGFAHYLLFVTWVSTLCFSTFLYLLFPLEWCLYVCLCFCALETYVQIIWHYHIWFRIMLINRRNKSISACNSQPLHIFKVSRRLARFVKKTPSNSIAVENEPRFDAVRTCVRIEYTSVCCLLILSSY